jgi:hypothetical protein
MPHSFTVSYTTKYILLCDPAILLLDIYPKVLKCLFHTKTCTQVLAAENLEATKMPSAAEWTEQTKARPDRGVLLTDELSRLWKTWRKVEHVLPRKRSQSEKATAQPASGKGRTMEPVKKSDVVRSKEEEQNRDFTAVEGLCVTLHGRHTSLHVRQSTETPRVSPSVSHALWVAERRVAHRSGCMSHCGERLCVCLGICKEISLPSSWFCSEPKSSLTTLKRQTAVLTVPETPSFVRACVREGVHEWRESKWRKKQDKQVECVLSGERTVT